LTASFFAVALGEGEEGREADGDGEDGVFVFVIHFAGVGEGTSPVTIFFTADKKGFDPEPAVGGAVELGEGFGC
jgi:hypothetical protein